MNNIEFSEKIDKYLQKKERDFKVFLLCSIILFILGFISDNSNLSTLFYVIGATFLGSSLRNLPNTIETKLLTTAVKHLSEPKNT